MPCFKIRHRANTGHFATIALIHGMEPRPHTTSKYRLGSRIPVDQRIGFTNLQHERRTAPSAILFDPTEVCLLSERSSHSSIEEPLTLGARGDMHLEALPSRSVNPICPCIMANA